jgi:dipeptidase D
MQSNIERILAYFEQINAIPRCSKSERALGEWLHQWAKSHGFDATMDPAGNLVVRVPSNSVGKDRPTVVLQGHMDMVCEKTPDSAHDFSKDPICSHRDGDWLMADRTTLGADNGIAIAYALALAEDETISRPPLELLFTVDEETGLNGVKAMAPGLISGTIMINLDSEDEGVFTIGCAGGVDTTLTMSLQRDPLPSEWPQFTLTVGGLRGGHSGIDIHKHRANANKLLARTIARIGQDNRFRLISIEGGSRHNAIARDAVASFAVAPVTAETISNAVSEMERILRQEYATADGDIFLKLEASADNAMLGATLEGSERAIALLRALPHGVAGMSPTLEGLVESSNNVALVSFKEDRLSILSSQRSSVASRLSEITETIHAVAELAGAQFRDENKYPAWQPDMTAPLLAQAQTIYRRLFSKEPVIQVIHAGLECAIIADRYPGMQMISFGPTIRNPHSPTERMHIPSVALVGQLLVGLLEELGR